jgi:hypothetical protein
MIHRLSPELTLRKGSIKEGFVHRSGPRAASGVPSVVDPRHDRHPEERRAA